MNRRVNISSVLMLMLTVLAGCERGEQAGPAPNVLLISVDTLRRDHLGCYGYERPTSPNIDELARRGVLFENMVSTSSWSLPAHASMLTGLYPSVHGLQNDGVKLPPDTPTVAQAFKSLGYRTVAVVSNAHVSSAYGLDRGFDTFDESLIDGGTTKPHAGLVVDRFLRWMSQTNQDQRFFGFIHFDDPHLDYTPPPPFDTRFTDPAYAGQVDGTRRSIEPFDSRDEQMPETDLRKLIALYDGEIAYVDSQIGQLLDGLRQRGLMDNTVVALTSGHGHEFKEHGRLGHGKTLFDEILGVPLIIAGHRAFRPGSRRSRVASPVDLAPTLLELAGENRLRNISGISQVKVRARDRATVFAETILWGIEQRSVRQGPYKLIHHVPNNRRYYYHLPSDPTEQRPLDRDPIGGRLASALADYTTVVDSGWHLNLICLTENTLRCRATIRTTGRLVEPRRYFTLMRRYKRARFATFELGPDHKTLTIDVSLTARFRRGEVSFETDPPDAPVTFKIQVTSRVAGAGVFLGPGERIANGAEITLERSDRRVVGFPSSSLDALPGCYIRAAKAPAQPAPKARLTDEAVEQLKTLELASGFESD